MHDKNLIDWSTTQFKRASAACGPNGGNCVEVAVKDGHVGIRDSKDAASPVLSFTFAEWSAFAEGMAAGEFPVPAS